MLGTLIVLILLLFFLAGIPVAFSIGITSILYIIITHDVSFLVISQRLVNSLDSFPLMAIPFFVLAGRLMNACTATDRIFDFANNLVGRVRGGLGHVNVLASMLFAGMSGSAVADASGLGAVEMKAMTDKGYDKNFSAAITASSSVIGPIIPPSIPAVIYGSMVSVSVGRLFLGGVIPGVVLGVSFMIRIFVVSRKRNYPRGKNINLFSIAKSFATSFPALLMPIILLGGIVIGFFTPTEAAAVSCGYALFLWIFVYRSFSIKRFLNELFESAKTVTVILFIIASASIFGLILTRQQVPQRLTESILSISNNPIVIILLVDMLLLLVGTVIEGTAALIILGPIIAMMAEKLLIDPVFMGIIVILNLMIGLITPPVGMVLYVLTRISGISMQSFIKEILGFLLMAVLVVIIISVVPGIVTWLPNLLMGPMK